MPFILILIAAILIIAAFNNSQAALVAELEQDVPPFLKWALAIVGVGALGWIPGMQTVSRWLLALVLVVMFLKNWSAIQSGITNFQNTAASGSTSAVNTTTAASAVPTQTTTNTLPGGTTLVNTGAATSTAQAANINAAAETPIYSSPYGQYDPSNFLADFAVGFGGFGGIA